MTDRTLNLLMAIVGVLAVAALAALGYDIYRAAATGPRWRRRLLGAGLALLGALGLPASQSDAGTAPPAENAARPASSLTDSAEWQRLAATWREAEEAASGKRGPYPFDRAGQQRLLAALATAAADVDSLQKASLLSDAEAGLLKLDLAQLTHGVQAKRPTELRLATCYEPMWYRPGPDSMKRLSDRLPLLERLAAAQKLNPEVVSKVLASVEQDVAALGKQEILSTVPEAERPRAAQLRDTVAAYVQRLKSGSAASRSGGGGGQLDTSAGWRAISDAWSFAVPLASSGKSTTAQRGDADAKLAAATRAAQHLAAVGLLAPEEAELIGLEAKNVREDVYRNPPTDARETCYSMEFIPPAHKSLRRLTQRLPLVERVVASGKVHFQTSIRIGAAIQADLAILADPKGLAQLPAGDRAAAEGTVRQAQAALRGLQRFLPPPTCYEPPPRPAPKPQSQRQLDERLARVEALERQGKLQPAVAALLRQGLRHVEPEEA